MLILTEETLLQGVEVLIRRDPHLAQIVDDFGPPPLWARQPGFPTLLHIILEQQVSLASAKAAYDRLLAMASPLTPPRFLELDDAALKSVGFSRQKMKYGRYLAEAIAAGDLDLSELESQADETVRARLIELKGIGPWTANIYLLMVLRRPDVWPRGDLALAVAAQQVKKLDQRPTFDELDGLAEAWRPWRAVAARLLWHYYLSR